LRLIDSYITQLEAQGPSRTCNESKEEEEKRTWAVMPARTASLLSSTARALRSWHKREPPFPAPEPPFPASIRCESVSKCSTPAWKSPSSSLISSLLHSHVNLEWCDKIKLSNPLLPRKSGTIKSLQLLSTSGTLLALSHGMSTSGLFKKSFCSRCVVGFRGFRVYFFFFFALVTGPRRSLTLKRSDTRVYEPQISKRSFCSRCVVGFRGFRV